MKSQMWSFTILMWTRILIWAREYRIMNIPAVIAIKGGQVAGQQIGLVSKDDMKGFIDGVF